jgi:NADPH-dependent ferric siderophore reductase
MERHRIERIRHVTRRRMLTIETIERLTPRMVRINFSADDLTDFVSASADDHIKLFFPSGEGNGESGEPCMRDFTPRSFDARQGKLVVDFALHETGPATNWAAAAKAGDTLQIGGPRGSAVIPDDFDWYVLIGDETALPAIGRRVEELRPDVPVTTIAVIASPEEKQTFDTKAAWTPVWCVRDGKTDDAALLQKALEGVTPPPGDGFVWIAAEAGVARALRNYLIQDRQHPREWIKAAGYWSRGKADSHTRIED